MLILMFMEPEQHIKVKLFNKDRVFSDMVQEADMLYVEFQLKEYGKAYYEVRANKLAKDMIHTAYSY